jgi:hypothetical protein
LQQGEGRPVFARDAAQPVTLRAGISDPNAENTHTIAWTAPSGASFSVLNGELELDPSSLPAGIHVFSVTVTDNGSPAASSTLRFEVVIAASAPSLPAGSAGWAQSGLPAHPDYSPPTRNVLPELLGDLDQRLIEAMPGVQLELGAMAREQGVLQAGLTGTATARLPADTVRNAGGVYDFTAALPRVGGQLTVVVPQSEALDAHAVYRMFDSATGNWHGFVDGPNDFILSAPAVNGVCPPPGSSVYAPGLTTGASCVQLLISDGGPNDRDGGANGKISLTGGVATLNEVSVTASGSGKSGGGGALDGAWLVLCAALLALRTRARRWMFGSLLALPLMASADEGWYVGGQWGQARGDSTEGRMNSELAELGHEATANFHDQTRAAWKLFGGYQFSRNLGVRAGYTELGEVQSTLGGYILDVNALLVDVTRLHPHSADGFEAVITGRYPFAARFAVAGELGVMRWDSKYRALNEAGEEIARFEDSGTDLLLGIGLEYSFSPRWTLGAQWTRYDIGGETVNLGSLALRYGFTAD